MQIPPPDAAQPPVTQATGAVAVRVLAGNLAAVPVGALLEATVTRAGPREVTLTVNGLPLTVRPNGQLQPGTVLFVRVPGGSATQTLELVGSRPTTPEAAAAAAPIPTKPAQVSLVDVLAVLPDGRLRVKIDGNEEVGASPEQLAPGGRYVLQVERTPAGLALRAAPDTPKLPAEVATAVLRGSPQPDLAAAVKPLLAELATLQSPTQATGAEPPQPVAVREAAAAVRDTVRAFLPSDARPPDKAELKNLVENGGMHFEAKLARLVAEDVVPAPAADGTPARPERLIGADLKGDLLRLLQAVQDLGGATQAPAAKAALGGIEAQQAANALAQNGATPYFLQVPFPDGGEWRTLYLALEPEHHGSQPDSGRPGGFRMLMHVPLTDLGETWIDAGLSDRRFRAVLYLETSTARDRVAAELPGLRDELRAEGFAEVLLDVRPAADLPARARRQAAAMRAGHPESVSVLDVQV
jgi:hypothetical protein